MVSVGKVETLDDAVRNLNAIDSQITTECAERIQLVADRTLELQREVNVALESVELAVLTELERERECTQAEKQLENAEAALVSENGMFGSSKSTEYSPDLDASELHDSGVNCSEVSRLEFLVFEMRQELATKVEIFERAKDRRIKMGQRAELLLTCRDSAIKLEAEVHAICDAVKNRLSSLLESGRTRLARAKDSLDAYLATNPAANQFYSWIKYLPESNSPVRPDRLNERIGLDPIQQGFLLEYLLERDSGFRTKIYRYIEELRDSRNPEGFAVPVELLVRRKVTKNLSGAFSEKIVEYALAPFGDTVDTQSRTVFEDGRSTKTDLIVRDLRVSIILGRGEGRSIPQGGTLAVEVKSGKKEYIYSQRDHMVYQAGGHTTSTAAITICSRDICDLPPEQQYHLRETMKRVGSPIIGMLPPKEEIDMVLWQSILQYSQDGSDEVG